MMKKALFYLLPTLFRTNRRNHFLHTDQSSTDKDSLKTLLDTITAWCVANEFLIRESPIHTNAINGKLRQTIYTLNLKRLSTDQYLTELLDLLTDTTFDKTTSRLIDLHIQIITEIDPRFLNLYINKLHYVLTTIYPDETPEWRWEEIFTTYPYLWLLFPIQRIMRQMTPL